MAALDKIARVIMTILFAVLYIKGTLSGKVVLMLYGIEAVFLVSSWIGSSLSEGFGIYGDGVI